MTATGFVLSTLYASSLGVYLLDSVDHYVRRLLLGDAGLSGRADSAPPSGSVRPPQFCLP